MGWNGSENRNAAPVPKKTAKTPPSKWRGLVALLVIVVGGIAAWIALRPAAPEPEAKHEARSTKHDIAEVAPQIATNVSEAAAQDANHSTQGTTTRSPSQQLTTDNQQPIAEPAATNADEAALADAKKNERILPSGADELIALATSAPPGASMPPLPGMSDGDTDDFIKAYRTPIEIKPDDSDEIKELKERVNSVRDEIAGMIAQDPNRSLSDILNEHRDSVNANAILTGDAQSEYDLLVSEGKLDDAEEYRQKANELLRNAGATEIQTDEEEEKDETNE